jgi:hypothetical protein
MRLEFFRADMGYAYANIYIRQKDRWLLAGVWQPLMRVVIDSAQGEKDWEIRPRTFTMGRTPDRITIPLMAVSFASDSPVRPQNAGRFYCPDATQDAPDTRFGTQEPVTLGLFWDAHLASDPAEQRKSRARVELAARNMLRDGGPGLFTSTANCHLMRWEFPFHYGYLPEAMLALERQMQSLMSSQQPDGGWIFEPTIATTSDTWPNVWKSIRWSATSLPCPLSST